MKPRVLLLATALLTPASPLPAQGGGDPQSSPFRQALREAQQLDRDGKSAEARAMFQRLIAEAPDPAQKAAAERRMAMSYGFVGDCAGAVRYHTKVIDYWKSREQAEPQNAFYQQGEMANESARVCIDSGDIDTAERMYRLGYELGNKEPEPRTHPTSLWDYRLAHALGRIEARRGNRETAERQVAEARRILNGDSAMAEDQERYFPYLAGYVALHTGDLAKAEAELTRALALNQNDPFMHCLLAMTYEKLGQPDQAKALYQKAYELATSHNPPSAFARPFARKKISGG